ncbi:MULTISPECIES: 6,7-dimethyl-8-ribityllumazine synthase [Leuconostoc]|uniref:6,7-dimethyl-8-ribityllumazine synthase n=1 Tax=Leuconostoc suionicum TaxID=1511761 RepID=A0A2N9K8T8_9LACO|nr:MULTISPECIES: 6,7-dimethyl-8-ribityllumazine synthase [Leuconostoc]API71883.1 6,7-dimethyl-8-ribityllumazine synthase [Leuconostoc suionicum]MBE4726934.1 6,7-dimethyl-8-ribityllumazine synthase [Leuconostoc suionicum]MBS1007934.1 6,7-dimethyl-8-ribityllumazine synthase [Leuconostoc suionicum]MCT4376524.1 6,7-dimethyl-8-ribityllumazine synthase [Leuconostoc suionicum]MCT4402687.1 6,7-dimethyl-8-ribityllumazine synthase [Leuconostoc suionicum]
MIYKAKLIDLKSKKIAIVVSKFNDLIVKQLLAGAQESLEMHGIDTGNIDIIWVPGALEIPMVAKKIAQDQKYDGIVTLGAVIKGDTAHYDLVINGVANGVSQISLSTDVPIVFGVLTTDTLEQAQQRSGAKSGNKGAEVALSLLELINIFDQIKSI